MEEDEKKIKNPSLRMKPERKDPLEMLRKQYLDLQDRYFEMIRKHNREKHEWERHYKRLCLVFLLVGGIIGFIIGAILL